MTQSELTKRALELAKENVARGGWPFSAVIEKDGEVIAEAANSVHKTNDPSDHAEIAAIRIATNRLGTPSLEGSTMYIIGPPCPMCNVCMIFAKISKVVFVVDIDNKDKALDKLPLTNGLYQALQDGYEVQSIEWQQDAEFMDEAIEVLSDWNDSQ